MKYIAVLKPQSELAETRTTLNALPESLAKAHPWIRQVASIRKDMQEVDAVLSI